LYSKTVLKTFALGAVLFSLSCLVAAQHRPVVAPKPIPPKLAHSPVVSTKVDPSHKVRATVVIKGNPPSSEAVSFKKAKAAKTPTVSINGSGSKTYTGPGAPLTITVSTTAKKSADPDTGSDKKQG
jgi:hypothetical protein